MACVGCGRDFHIECEISDCIACHGEQDQAYKSLSSSGNGVGAPFKDPSEVTDKFSTGRKRAAAYWPLFRDKPCDWRGKKNCGGGHPIIGCITGMQMHRHHGPVKNTLRNEPGNVHRICTNCHARWHAVNDPLYNEDEYEELKHEPEEATEMELLTNDAEWKMKKLR